MEEQFKKEIHALAQQIKGMHDQAVAVYTPLVDDICSRVAPMKEVEWLQILKEDKEEYIKALITTREEDNLDIFGDFMSTLMHKNLSSEIDSYLKSIDESEESREEISKGSKKTGKSREKIIALLSENGKLTAAGLASEIGITAKAVEKHLAKLKAEGIIQREGPDKGGTWKVK